MGISKLSKQNQKLAPHQQGREGKCVFVSFGWTGSKTGGRFMNFCVSADSPELSAGSHCETHDVENSLSQHCIFKRNPLSARLSSWNWSLITLFSDIIRSSPSCFLPSSSTERATVFIPSSFQQQTLDQQDYGGLAAHTEALCGEIQISLCLLGYLTMISLICC